MRFDQYDYDKAYTDLLDLFRKYKVPFHFLTEQGCHDTKTQVRSKLTFAYNVLLRAYFTPEQAKWIVYGIPVKNFKCSFEMKGGWGSMYAYAVITQAVEAYIRRVYHKDARFEVGFDVSKIVPRKLMEKYNLSGEPELIEGAMSYYFRTQYPNDNRKPDYWEVWRDAQGNTFSFQGGMKRCYYQGYTFVNVEAAFEFVKWAISQKDFFIKEIDLLRNGFGGIGLEDLKQHEERKAEALAK